MSPAAPVAILGAGEIGSGWAALFASYGAEVRIVDPDPRALQRAHAALACARALRGGAESGHIRRAINVTDAVRGAIWVQESVPEGLVLKRTVLAQLEGVLAPGAIVASSTSTLGATVLGEGLTFASRLVIAHPLYPVYAVPVVELCGGRETLPATIIRAAETLRLAGREPIVVQRELPGLVANRLTAALLREALDLVAQGAISVRDLDHLVSRGIATGWATRGPLHTELAGSGATTLDEFVRRAEGALAALLASLADWRAMSPAGREALRRATQGSRETMSECEWASTIARVLKAAKPSG
ncbi:MAG: 3-hydroxyacyl-CoA dehydrogenase NAD-binding domain-containing protein [Gemmatimonadota bacterium]